MQCTGRSLALGAETLPVYYHGISLVPATPKHLGNNRCQHLSACQSVSHAPKKARHCKLQGLATWLTWKACLGEIVAAQPLAIVLQVQFWAPTAAGGGVSLVMAFLNGTDVPDLLRLRTLITKFVGSIFSCAANLTVGTEGPLVHMGACIASVIAFWECGTRSCLHILTV